VEVTRILPSTSIQPPINIENHQKLKFCEVKMMMMIYLLTAIGLSPGGRNTVHIYTQTIHRTVQNKNYIEQHNNWKGAGRAPSWLVIPWH